MGCGFCEFVFCVYVQCEFVKCFQSFLREGGESKFMFVYLT